MNSDYSELCEALNAFYEIPGYRKSLLRSKSNLVRTKLGSIGFTIDSKLVTFVIFWIDITWSTLWSSRDMSDIGGKETRQTKICDLNQKIVVKENVVCFYIAVDDIRSMEIGQSSRCLNGNLHSSRKWECTGFCKITMKMISNCAIRNVFINKQEFTASARGAAIQ
ncbi:hypothetical protein CFP56_015003 [Quercus suber]|uniref:Uncharacterized protein n=1 Tax=Quercus suber TaxID=58331 RepID=A0AAW0KSX2_QUESU